MNGLPSGTIVARRYRIIRLLGAGGMGMVYQARDVRDNRVVALKIISHSLVKDDELRRFIERQQLRLDHPNILHVREQGRTSEGLYIATDFIDGRSLAQILKERTQLEPDYAIEIAIRVGVALAFAHRQGVIHRDVKPGNIIVSTHGNVLLADFDLQTRPDATTITRDGMIAGTPAYMSPEQVAGMPLDGRSDIFSLGAVLYLALTGRHWWAPDRELSSAIDILQRVVTREPVSARTLVPELSETVDLVLQKALAKDPKERYEIADDFVKALTPSPAVPLGLLARAVDTVAGTQDDQTGMSMIAAPTAPFDNARRHDGTSPTSHEPDEATVDVPAYLPQSEDRLREFAALWDKIADASQNNRERFVALTDTLARGLLREAIGYRVGDTIPHFRGTVGCMVEAPFLWIRQSRFPLLFVSPGNSGDVLATVVHQLAVAQATEFFALLVVVPPRDATTGREADELRREVQHSIYRHDFVVLDRELVASIIAHNSSMQLIEIILEQVDDLSVLSPYVVRGPVPAQMFFGREGEIKVISQGVQGNDYAVVGGRRIGKSSTLLRLTRLLGDDPRYRAIYIDCEAFFEDEDLFAGLREHVDTPAGGDPLAFRNIARRLREVSAPRSVVLLLDEIDELLAFDAVRSPGGQLFKTFRSVSHEGLCRFVFSGSRTLAHQLRDPRSPFFNFCEAIALRRLDQQSVAEIVRKPMRQLGIDMPDEDALVQRVIDVTSCHPNLAQWVCDRLVRSSVERRVTRLALEQVLASPEFREHYIGTAWGDATPLEKLISVAMRASRFGLNDVLQTLRPFGITDATTVREALAFLQLCSLFDCEGNDRCRFGLEHFPAVARESGVLPHAIESLAVEARQQCS